jgi:hypothetical protein
LLLFLLYFPLCFALPVIIQCYKRLRVWAGLRIRNSESHIWLEKD